MELDKQIESARHKEVIASLGKVASVVKDSNQAVAKLIENNTKEIGNFGKQLAALEIKVESPVVNVKTDLSELSKEIKEVKDGQLRIETLLTEQNEYLKEICKQKEWTFTLNRGYGGYLEKVTATSKVTTDVKKQMYKN